jgi:hypothetical protein
MKMAAIKKAADKISKKYGMPLPIVEKVTGPSLRGQRRKRW